MCKFRLKYSVKTVVKMIKKTILLDSLINFWQRNMMIRLKITTRIMINCLSYSGVLGLRKLICIGLLYDNEKAFDEIWLLEPLFKVKPHFKDCFNRTLNIGGHLRRREIQVASDMVRSSTRRYAGDISKCGIYKQLSKSNS